MMNDSFCRIIAGAINFLDIATDCQGHRGGPFDHAFIELQRRFLMPGHKATELKPVALAQV